MQWVRLPDGSWISEKNPGYPYLALPFAAVGLLRVAPLWYGALACIALFAGARRWLRPWAGLWAVGLFLASGAALVFAWRATMPTFTDAALVATGAGGLLWCLLARDLTARWRTAAGAAAFLALSLAVAARYTNVVPLIAATVVAAATFRRSGLSRWALAWWAAPVVLVGGFLALFDLRYYGTLTGTGYASGLITFSLSAVPDNLRILPPRLIVAMPATVLAVVALGWGAVRLVVVRGPAADPDRVWSVRADAVVGAALAGGWLGLWALYAAYDWTARMAMDSEVDAAVHLIRFYVPALGLVALLGAWVLARWPTWLSGVLLAVLAVAAVLSFGQLAADGPGRGGGPPPGGGPAPGIGPLPGGGPAPSGVPAPTGGPSPGGPPAGGAPPGG